MSNKRLKKIEERNLNRGENDPVILPDIKDIYPYKVKIDDLGDKMRVGRTIIEWLENHCIMVNSDFFFDLRLDRDDGKVMFRFKKKKHKRFMIDKEEEIDTILNQPVEKVDD